MTFKFPPKLPKEWIQGYVKNRTKEVALAAILGALFFVTRYIRIPIAPPAIMVDFSASFWILGIIVLPYLYVWLFAFMLGVTSYAGILTIIGHAIGLHIFYFLAKLVGIRKVKYIIVLAPFLTAIPNIIFLTLVLCILPFSLAPFALLHALIHALIAIVIVPSFIFLLEKIGVIHLEGSR